MKITYVIPLIMKHDTCELTNNIIPLITLSIRMYVYRAVRKKFAHSKYGHVSLLDVTNAASHLPELE